MDLEWLVPSGAQTLFCGGRSVEANAECGADMRRGGEIRLLHLSRAEITDTTLLFPTEPNSPFMVDNGLSALQW